MTISEKATGTSDVQAVKRVWSEDLESQLQDLSVKLRPALIESLAGQPPSLVSTTARPVADEIVNVVRPAVFQRETSDAAPGRQRPELSTILAVVTKAAEHVKNADDRAERTQRQAAELALRTRAQLERAEVLLESAQNAIRALEGEIEAVTDRLAEAEADTADARDRVFAAETRAIEAREDMAYLECCIREQFGIAAI